MAVEIGDANLAMQHRKEDVEQVRKDLLTIISILLIALGTVAALLVVPDFTDTWWWRFLLYLSLILEGMIIYALRQKFPLLSQSLLVIGPVSSYTWALWLIKSPTMPCYAVLVVIANFAISPLAGVMAAILSSAALLVLQGMGDLVPLALTLIWLTAILQWVALRGFSMALTWSQSSQQRASALLEQLRRRQGELNRTLAALTEASRRLERVNHELAIARQEAEQARALKEQFVANVSHELRTPLNLVVGFAEMMYLDADGYEGVRWTPELVSDVAELYRASQHLQSLVNDILDLSRIDASRLPMFRELQDIGPILREAVETIRPLAEQHGLCCTIEPFTDLPPVFVDRTRIRQIMINLLNNAVRFTNQGGITVRAKVEGATLLVSVRDTGVGIPEDQLGKLFERFYQAEAGFRSSTGAGLGLALGRQFVEMHGGRIWAESQTGVGSLFTFALPLPGTMPQASALRRTPATHTMDTSDAPVIVVDPDPDIPEMLGRYLDDRPALHALDPSEVEGIIETERPIGIIINQPPDAPENAWLGPLGELSRRYAVPIVRCSIPSPGWLARSIGLDDCLAKPVTRESLARVLHKYCNPQDRVLVVDDNPGFIALMARLLDTLKLAGEVLTAHSGAEGLRIARERAPRLILLDLLMPDMDGFQVLAELRRDPALRDIRVVGATAAGYELEMLRWRGGQFTLTRADGISAAALVELLNVVFRHVRPHYLTDKNTSSNA
jgi:signal transduction histidine kinase/CheY-like chemotaxis protein